MTLLTLTLSNAATTRTTGRGGTVSLKPSTAATVFLLSTNWRGKLYRYRQSVFLSRIAVVRSIRISTQQTSAKSVAPFLACQHCAVYCTVSTVEQILVPLCVLTVGVALCIKSMKHDTNSPSCPPCVANTPDCTRRSNSKQHHKMYSKPTTTQTQIMLLPS